MVTLNLPLAINIVKTNYILYIEVFCNCFFLTTTYNISFWRYSISSFLHFNDASHTHYVLCHHEYLSDSQNVLNNLKDCLQFKKINLKSFYYYQIFIVLLKMYAYSNYNWRVQKGDYLHDSNTLRCYCSTFSAVIYSQ